MAVVRTELDQHGVTIEIFDNRTHLTARKARLRHIRKEGYDIEHRGATILH